MSIITTTFEAGERKEFPVTGNYFRGLSADAVFTLEIQELQVKTDFLAGLGWRSPVEFSKIAITSATAQTIQFITATGDIDDSRLAGQIDITGALSTQEAGAGGVLWGQSTVGMVAAQILAADATRRNYLLQMKGVGKLYVGYDNTVSAATGIEVGPGGTFDASNTAAVWVISDTVAQDVRYHVERN